MYISRPLPPRKKPLPKRKFPYIPQKQQVTITLDSKTIEFFKRMSAKKGIPFQTLISLYLSDCAENNSKPDIPRR